MIFLICILLKKKLFILYWSITDWQCCASFRGTVKGLTHTYQLSSGAQSCPTLRPHGLQHARPPCPSPTQSLLKLMSIESVMPSSHLILCHLLLLLPPIPPSIRVFSNESVLRIRWPKYWSFGFSISPSNEYSGLFPFRMDWLDLLADRHTHCLLNS